MFEDSLMESSGRLRSRNPWTTAVSFATQMVIGGIAVLISLLYTDALPVHTLISTMPAPPPPQTAAATHVIKALRQSNEFHPSVLVPPTEIPKSIAVVHDDRAASESASQPSLGVPNGVSNSPSNSMISELLRSTLIAMPKVILQKVRVSSGVAQGLLIHEVTPQYPSLARQARIQGTVVLQAVIAKDGTVQDLHVVSGHPLLTAAAIDAVKQWRYRPYYLNGEPVAVDTQIDVNFTLASP